MNTRTAELTEIKHNLQQEINARMHAEAALHRGNEFICVISYELRTPLTSLHSALKLLATGRLGHLSATGQQMLAIATTGRHGRRNARGASPAQLSFGKWVQLAAISEWN